MSKSIYKRLRRIEERLEKIESWMMPVRDDGLIAEGIQQAVYKSFMSAAHSSNYGTREESQGNSAGTE